MKCLTRYADIILAKTRKSICKMVSIMLPLVFYLDFLDFESIVKLSDQKETIQTRLTSELKNTVSTLDSGLTGSRKKDRTRFNIRKVAFPTSSIDNLITRLPSRAKVVMTKKKLKIVKTTADCLPIPDVFQMRRINNTPTKNPKAR